MADGRDAGQSPPPSRPWGRGECCPASLSDLPGYRLDAASSADRRDDGGIFAGVAAGADDVEGAVLEFGNQVVRIGLLFGRKPHQSGAARYLLAHRNLQQPEKLLPHPRLRPPRVVEYDGMFPRDRQECLHPDDVAGTVYRPDAARKGAAQILRLARNVIDDLG